MKNVPWQSTTERVSQPHDEPAPDIQMSKNYLSAKWFYCVETICAPCGVVVAWTKFDKSESPTKFSFWSLFIQLRNQDMCILLSQTEVKNKCGKKQLGLLWTIIIILITVLMIIFVASGVTTYEQKGR